MDFNQLHRIIGEKVEPGLLEEALTHRSFGEGLKTLPNFERLEFLGDSVLGFVVTEDIFKRFPHLSEGKLTQVRLFLVSEPNLALAAKRCGLNEHIRVGKSVVIQGASQRPSILSDAFEAVIGAIYMDLGLAAAAAFIHREILAYLGNVDEMLRDIDPRGDLLDFCTKKKLALRFDYEETGKSNQIQFVAKAYIENEFMGQGVAGTRKAAAGAAAAAVLANPALATKRPKKA